MSLDILYRNGTNVLELQGQLSIYFETKKIYSIGSSLKNTRTKLINDEKAASIDKLSGHKVSGWKFTKLLKENS